MDKKIVDKITTAWQEVVVNEKKKLDPVGKADADIDNDGDVDKSDEYLHNRRKEIKKAMKEEDEDDIKMDSKGMKKCSECGGSTENHDEECSKYKGEEKQSTKESVSVRHTEHGHGEIIAESDEGVDVLFAHGVEFNVPAEQLEGVSSAIKTAKRMGGDMTGAVKKIEKSKKGMSDNPRVQKALKKANEEDELEEKLETQRSKLPNGQRPKGPGWVLKKSGEQSGKPHSEWERKTKRVESVQEGTVAEFEEEVVAKYANFVQGTKAALAKMWEAAAPKDKHVPSSASDEEMKDKLKGKGAKDMAKDADMDSPEVAADDEEGHDDVVKAGRAVKKQASVTTSSKGDTKIIDPVKGQVTKPTK